MGYHRHHIFQLLYLIHERMVKKKQYEAASLVMELIRELKHKPDLEIKQYLEDYEPRILIDKL